MDETRGKILEGVLAINKPPGISSAQVLRDLQHTFQPSRLFAPYLEHERSKRSLENSYQKQRRSKAKRGSPQVKIGHGGTLDPLATGVLIAGIGKGTKELARFLECSKRYETVVLFGAATDTYDRAGKVIGRKPYEHITKEVVEEALKRFRGKIMQRPPIYSALHVQGKRLYEYAREGKEVPIEIPERPVETLQLDLKEWLEPGSHEYTWPAEEAAAEDKNIAQKVLHIATDNDGLDTGSKRKREEDDATFDKDNSPDAKKVRESLDEPSHQNNEIIANANHATEPQITPKPPAVRITMTVTSGFYVRSLAHDLGEAVGSLAHMSDLVRTRQADFELGKNVLEYEDIRKGEDVWGPQVEAMLDDWNEKQEESKLETPEKG